MIKGITGRWLTSKLGYSILFICLMRKTCCLISDSVDHLNNRGVIEVFGRLVGWLAGCLFGSLNVVVGS